MMERLTTKDIGKVCFDTWELCGLDNVCKRDCRKPTPCKIPNIVYALAAYEDTKLTPAEITDHEEMFKAYRAVCGGKSPEQITTMQIDYEVLKLGADTLSKKYETLQEENSELKKADQEFSKLIKVKSGRYDIDLDDITLMLRRIDDGKIRRNPREAE